jgi:hypothetical protein
LPHLDEYQLQILGQMDQRKSKYLATERDCGRRSESIHAADGTGISIRLVKIISVMLGKIAEAAEYFAQVCADCRAMCDTVLTMVGATAALETCSFPLRCDQVLIGRTISVPIGWYPRLAHAAAHERTNFQISGAGYGLHWPDLDEDIGVEGLILGKRSTESAASFDAWLKNRAT